jgi:hypothetical protein
MFVHCFSYFGVVVSWHAGLSCIVRFKLLPAFLWSTEHLSFPFALVQGGVSNVVLLFNGRLSMCLSPS